MISRVVPLPHPALSAQYRSTPALAKQPHRCKKVSKYRPLPYPCAADEPTLSPASLQVATRLGKKSDAAPKFTDFPSPLKRRLSDFGKAVASAITRDNSTLSETETVSGRIEPAGVGQRGNGDAFPIQRAAGKGGTSSSIGRFTASVAGMNPRSPAERRRTMSDDSDFGVQVDELSW